MNAGNYSVEAAIIDNGKVIKGTLSLFNDEYVFGNIRKTVNWEKVTCDRGTVNVKVFLRNVEKEYIVFNYSAEKSQQFILEAAQINDVINKVKFFSEKIARDRMEKENRERKAEEERQAQVAKEEKIREDAKRKAEEEFRQKKELEQKERQEAIQRSIAIKKQRENEKAERVKKLVETIRAKEEKKVELSTYVEKAASVILDNPYRTLGISCTASREDANVALDKLKKMARLNAIESYKSEYDLVGIDRPDRDLSVAQNALVMLKNYTNKFFWFVDSDPCCAWQDGKYRIELVKDGEELGSYDLFLANYMYTLLCDSDFNISETWKRIFNYYAFICKQNDYELLKSRFSEAELKEISNIELLNSFRTSIFKPLLLLCERDDLDAVIRLYKYIRDCDNRLLEGLSRSVLAKIVSWFTDKESSILSFLSKFYDDESLTDENGEEICKRGEEYCLEVEQVLESVLMDLRGDLIRYDMIKESYRSVTYQLMYELNKCPNKSNAIIFANKCYSYCNSDDKKRIQYTFGEANIKAIDWNVPHTSWDSKGDDFYFGRGCEQDFTQALYWYHKAADEGNMYSMNSIGLCYQNGNGVPQSDELASTWFMKAADAGNPQGAYNLAECYFAGVGVKKNIDDALKYWGEAAKLGHPSAESRKKEIFAEVQMQRKNHRARNHICHDLGFQVITGPRLVVEVSINLPANVYLVNAQGYQNYLNGNEFIHEGGHATDSLYRIQIPSSNHWYVIIDNGDEPITGIQSSAKVRNL